MKKKEEIKKLRERSSFLHYEVVRLQKKCDLLEKSNEYERKLVSAFNEHLKKRSEEVWALEKQLKKLREDKHGRN